MLIIRPGPVVARSVIYNHTVIDMKTGLTIWSGSLHQTFELIPPAEHLRVILGAADGESSDAVTSRMPFHISRSRSGSKSPNARRFRDVKQLYETAGLMHVIDGRIRFTAFGMAVKRFLPKLNEANAILLGRHAALALNVCQLRNPTDAGSKYAASMMVFPNRFIWKAMLKLEGMISSDELNRGLFKVRNEEELPEAIERIREFRETGNAERLGNETIAGRSKNDRIIPFISIASFGWLFIAKKDRGKKESGISGYYQVRPQYRSLLRAAINTPVRHRDFESTEAYMRHISSSACLPV